MIHEVEPLAAPVPAKLDGTRFQDQSRHWSPEVTRAFTSVIQAVALGAQSEMSEPDEVTLERNVD